MTLLWNSFFALCTFIIIFLGRGVYSSLFSYWLMYFTILESKVLDMCMTNDDVIKWKRFPRYWPFVQGIHRWPVNSPHKGQWRGAFMFSLICAIQSGGWWFETPSHPLWRHGNKYSTEPSNDAVCYNTVLHPSPLCITRATTQRTHHAIMTSLLR